jgi:hypothetical protein
MPPKQKQNEKKKNGHDLWAIAYKNIASDPDYKKALGKLGKHMKDEYASVGQKYAKVSTDVGRRQVLALIERKAKQLQERRGHPGIDKICATLMVVKDIANTAASANPITSFVVAALFMAFTVCFHPHQGGRNLI